jgi:hypothetical protein
LSGLGRAIWLPALEQTNYAFRRIHNRVGFTQPDANQFDSGDEANAVAFDSTAAIIVTGGADSASDNLDIVTIKYDRDGNFQWIRRYDSGNGGLDEGLFIAVNAVNDIIVCGRSFIGGVSGEDIYTVKYNGSNGVTESEIHYTTSGTKLSRMTCE